MTAATNSAVESCLDLADEPLGGHDRQVRQDREPDDHPGDDPGGQKGARVVAAREQAVAGGGQGQSDGASERGAKDADVADQAVPFGSAGVPW